MRYSWKLALCFLLCIGKLSAVKLVGLNAAYEDPTYLADAQALHAKWIRVENWNGKISYSGLNPSPTVGATLDLLATKGIKGFPLVNSYSTSWVTAAGQQAWINNVTYYARTYGKGGTYWAGKTDMGSDVIEVANEAYGQWYPWPDQGYLHPGSYAQMLKAAAISVKSATSNRVKLLASVITDYYDTADGKWKQWDAMMKAAVPDIASYLGGVVVHPYGDVPQIGIGTSTDPNWSHQVLYTIHTRWGASVPVYVTEVGQKGPKVGNAKQEAAMNYYFSEFTNNTWQYALFWYNQKDYSAYNPSGDNGWGLVNENNVRLPSWYAYQTNAARFP